MSLLLPDLLILNADQTKKSLYYSISFGIFQGVIEDNLAGNLALT